MDLVKEVLAGVSDTRLLTDHKPGPTPLHNLIKEYKEKSVHNDNVPNLVDASTGLDLKNGIGLMPVEDQVSLLTQYLVDAKRIVPLETPAEVETRKVRNLAIRVSIWIIGIVAIMLFGAVTTIAVRTGALPSNEVVGTFLEFAGEIVHLIFAGPGE